MYGLLSFVIGGAVDLFYRRVSLGGEVPRSGPVLLVANHPNGLIDPVVVANTAGRRIRVLAKAPLFDMPGISLIVKGAGALPVYRAKDGADTAHNEFTFRAVAVALREGSAVLIFPEGMSHDEPQLQKLKTGGARMALQACAAGAADLCIVPVGLVYRWKDRFRSEVATQVGEPLRVASYLDHDALAPDDPAVVTRLTEDMAASLRAVTINLDQWQDLPLLEAVDAIWRVDEASRTARVKQLADGVELLRAHAPKRLDAARAEVVAWTQRLDDLGMAPRDLAPEHIAARRDPAKLLAFALKGVALLGLGLPMALFGAAFWAVPFWLIHGLTLLVRPTRDIAATGKVLLSILLFPAWHALLTWLLWRQLGAGSAVLAAATAPIAGMTTRWFFRGHARAWRHVATFFALLLRRDLRKRLEAEKDVLLEELDALEALAQQLPDQATRG